MIRDYSEAAVHGARARGYKQISYSICTLKKSLTVANLFNVPTSDSLRILFWLVVSWHSGRLLCWQSCVFQIRTRFLFDANTSNDKASRYSFVVPPTCLPCNAKIKGREGFNDVNSFRYLSIPPYRH